MLHYLLRMEPFTTWAVELQGGRFDCPDRLFFSVNEAWNSCTNSMSDVKELIPEFFYNHIFLSNSNNLDLGERQPANKGEHGTIVNDVELPPWAHGSSYEFVRVMRCALESDYVSEHLHLWIDLIFGCKQRGAAAEKAQNLFFYLTYEGGVDLDSFDDPLRRAATEEQIRHFGQTPSLLFSKPHPQRKAKGYEDTFVLCPTLDAGWDIHTVELLTFLLPPEFTSGSKKKEIALPLHPGMVGTTKKNNIGVVKILPIRSSVTSSTEKLIVVYTNGTVSIHKWSPSKPRAAKNSKNSNLKKTSSNASTNHRVPSVNSTNSTDSVSTAGDPAVLKFQWSTPKCMPMHGMSSETQLHEQLFATSNAGKLMFFGGCWDNRLKYCALDVSTRASFSGPFELLQGNGSTFRDKVTCLSFAEDGMTLGVGCMDTTCQIWKVKTRDEMKMLHLISTHQGSITAIRLSVMLDIVVSSSMDGTLAIHTLKNGQLLRSIAHPTGRSWDGVWMMGISHGDVLGYSREEQRLHLYSVHGDNLMSCATEDVKAATTTADGEALITGDEHGIITFRTLASSLQVVRKVNMGISSAVACIEVSQHHILVGFQNGSIGVISERK